MSDESIYDEWIANRRDVEPPCGLADRVMDEVIHQDARLHHRVRLTERMNNIIPARWAACLSASLVGSLPFFYVAYAARLLVF